MSIAGPCSSNMAILERHHQVRIYTNEVLARHAILVTIGGWSVVEAQHARAEIEKVRFHPLYPFYLILTLTFLHLFFFFGVLAGGVCATPWYRQPRVTFHLYEFAVALGSEDQD